MIVSLVDTRTKTGNQVTMITEDSHIALFQSSVFFYIFETLFEMQDRE